MQFFASIGILILLGVCDAFFHDDYLFNVNWPGNSKTFANPELYESFIMKTKDNEEFACMLPNRIIGRDDLAEEPTQSKPQSVMELLKPLFDQTACSYKIDVYWNYELCHGRHARQYHESKGTGAETTVTGFYLGYYKPQPLPAGESAEATADAKSQKAPLTVLVEGQQLPYYEVVMRDGTVCDLSGQPRQTQIWYVCSLDGKGEIAELLETASCRYRIVVLTRLLCDHPLFRPKRTHVNQLHCLPHGAAAAATSGGRKRPKALADMEAAAEKQVRASVQSLEGIFGADARVEILHKGGQVFIAVHALPSGGGSSSQQQPQATQQPPPAAPELPRVSPAKFFSGSACVVGGSTWWRHQVCFRSRVTQFHVFDDGKKAEILLGAWDPQAHVRAATERRLLPMDASAGRTELVQFYTGGDVCDDGGAAVGQGGAAVPRQREPHRHQHRIRRAPDLSVHCHSGGQDAVPHHRCSGRQHGAGAGRCRVPRRLRSLSCPALPPPSCFFSKVNAQAFASCVAGHLLGFHSQKNPSFGIVHGQAFASH